MCDAPILINSLHNIYLQNLGASQRRLWPAAAASEKESVHDFYTFSSSCGLVGELLCNIGPFDHPQQLFVKRAVDIDWRNGSIRLPKDEHPPCHARGPARHPGDLQRRGADYDGDVRLRAAHSRTSRGLV